MVESWGFPKECINNAESDALLLQTVTKQGVDDQLTFGEACDFGEYDRDEYTSSD